MSKREATSPLADRSWSAAMMRILERSRWSRPLTALLTLAAVLSGLGTYFALTGVPPLGRDPQTLAFLIYLDGFLLLLLLIVVSLRLVAIWSARRRGSAGSRIHVRLVWLFGLLAVVPASLIALFSVLFLDLGLESWFSSRVKVAVEESTIVAEAYLEEHQRGIQADALRIARDLAQDAAYFDANPQLLQRALLIQTSLRDITEAIVFERNGPILARAGLTFSLEFEAVPAEALRAAEGGDIVLLPTEDADRVRALVRLENFLNHYLLVGRSVDPEVLRRLAQVRDAAEGYEAVESQRSELQTSFAFAFVMVTLLLVMASVWIGLSFATRLTEPISALIAATEQLRGGDLSARVHEALTNDELDTLSRAFNRMAAQLATQHAELMEAARQMDERRRFTEAVLSGVSAGVIGLDVQGRINLPNRSASQLLGLALEELVGHRLVEVVPELAAVLDRAREHDMQPGLESELKIRVGGIQRFFLVRLGFERGAAGALAGYVLTFDDITELQSAQRKAAWADVARRIAHEIKNPLTPIQLSAERLKRKYLKEIKTDPDVFVACTDTIIRQVGDIERMVNEFSNFARMPAPVMRPENLSELVKEAVFLQRNAYKDTSYIVEGVEQAVQVKCDGRQISQALTNILQNAHDAIEGRKGVDLPAGRIVVTVVAREDRATVIVCDNGKGLPQEERDRLTEPYVTTRAKGTGLGLAIVKKIMEDHGGTIALNDAPGGGAEIRLEFPMIVADEAA